MGVERGYGASPNATTALIRALTECAQSRAGELEGLREDVQGSADQPAPDATGDGRLARRRTGGAESPPHPAPSSGDRVLFGDVPSFDHDDLALDIELILTSLSDAGLSRALVCDLSPPHSPFHVVRVVVPGQETWAFDGSKLGPRALAAWNRQAATRQPEGSR
jgi:ribosomal protein S12 methylthiotransferase accessory factor